MWPEFFRIGPLTISPYGILVAVGFFAAMALASRLASRREGLDGARILDFSLTLVLVALLGAKLLMLVTDPYYYEHPANVVSWEFIRSAGVFYGGFLAALVYAAWYFRRHHLPGWKTADAFAPAIALGHTFGRLGCFTAGCCFGRPTDGPLGVVFSNPLCSVEPGFLGIPLYPVQLMEALGNLLIFIGLMLLYRRKRFDGQMILVYVMAYGILRFILEFFRGDVRGWVIPNALSTSQAIIIVLLPVAMWLFLRRWKSARGASSPKITGRPNR
jgi:phosphatidylglycerol:prolipoprotein diacylglycerol transferase